VAQRAREPTLHSRAALQRSSNRPSLQVGQALTQAGKPYDFYAIGGIAFDRNWRDSHRWFCSELIAAAFEAAGSPLLNPSANVWRITPRDLLLSMNLAAVSAISIPN
jgi:uncharacterized protein YycO